jgi:hypothetical protein
MPLSAPRLFHFDICLSQINSISAEQLTAAGMRPSLSCASLKKRTAPGGAPMLWTIFVILLVLWLLGVVSSYTLGGFIHILLVLALVVLLIQLISGRRAV